MGSKRNLFSAILAISVALTLAHPYSYGFGRDDSQYDDSNYISYQTTYIRNPNLRYNQPNNVFYDSLEDAFDFDRKRSIEVPKDETSYNDTLLDTNFGSNLNNVTNETNNTEEISHVQKRHVIHTFDVDVMQNNETSTETPNIFVDDELYVDENKTDNISNIQKRHVHHSLLNKMDTHDNETSGIDYFILDGEENNQTEYMQKRDLASVENEYGDSYDLGSLNVENENSTQSNFSTSYNNTDNLQKREMSDEDYDNTTATDADTTYDTTNATTVSDTFDNETMSTTAMPDESSTEFINNTYTHIDGHTAMGFDDHNLQKRDADDEDDAADADTTDDTTNATTVSDNFDNETMSTTAMPDESSTESINHTYTHIDGHTAMNFDYQDLQKRDADDENARETKFDTVNTQEDVGQPDFGAYDGNFASPPSNDSDDVEKREVNETYSTDFNDEESNQLSNFTSTEDYHHVNKRHVHHEVSNNNFDFDPQNETISQIDLIIFTMPQFDENENATEEVNSYHLDKDKDLLQ